MIEDTLQYKAQVRLLGDAARRFAGRGWLPAGAGALSARIDDGQIVITAPGRCTDRLADGDFVVVDLEGNVLSPGKAPAAETLLHIAIYRRDPEVGAVLHALSPHATALSLLGAPALTLAGQGPRPVSRAAWPLGDRPSLPVFEHTPNTLQLAAQVDESLNQNPAMRGFLVSGDGLYGWGRSVEAAADLVEAFSYLLECELLMRSARQ